MQNKHSNSKPVTLKGFALKYIKDGKLYILGFFIVILIWAVEMSVSPYLLGKIVNITANNAADHNKVINLLLLPAILYVSMSLILNINFRVYNYLSLKLYPQMKANITNDMYSYLIKHAHNFFINNFTGSLTKKINDMSNGMEQIITIPCDNFFPGIFALIIGCITLYISVEPIFALILSLWGISFVILTFYAAKNSAEYAERFSSAESELSGAIADSISNIQTTKLFANSKFEIKRNQQYIKDVVHKDQQLQLQNLIVFAIQGLGVTVLIACMMTALIIGYQQNKISAGDFALVLSLSVSFSLSIANIGEELLRFSKVVGTCQQALSFIKVPHEITDSDNAHKLKLTQACIEYKNLSFAYLHKKPLFTNLSVKIHSGEKIGLVGHSGAGKTTFVKLILRFIKPQSGLITIDNQDINEVTEQSLINSIATIPQDTELFHRSIMENIRAARSNATDEEVISAAKKAKCHSFIMQLPNNYLSQVGEKGIKLSGGQRQRISIARAFLKNSKILILDEATSSLDTITEQEIQEALYEVMQNRTTIVIAHRLSTLKNMDRIIVFDNGNIIEQGTIEQLLENENSVFKNLWQNQSNDMSDSVIKNFHP